MEEERGEERLRGWGERSRKTEKEEWARYRGRKEEDWKREGIGDREEG